MKYIHPRRILTNIFKCLYRNKALRLSKYWCKMAVEGAQQYEGATLTFHYVSNKKISLPSVLRVWTTIEFEKFLYVCMYVCMYRFVSIDDGLEIIRMNRKEKFVIITFDDVPVCFYNEAYPILKKMNIPFTLFVAWNCIGCDGYLSQEQVVELSKDPLCTIGAHTISHGPLLTLLNAKYELTESKKKLEELLNKPVKYMAYPYGNMINVSKGAIMYAKKAGYECAFSTTYAPFSEESTKNMFFLPRMSIDPNKFNGSVLTTPQYKP